MLIPINISKQGDITFDENLVCSVGFLRDALNKHGKKAVAAIVLYSDVLSVYHSMPDEVKKNEIASSLEIKQTIFEEKLVKEGLQRYATFIKETAIGKLLVGFEKKMNEQAQLMLTTEMTLDTMDLWNKSLEKIAETPKNYSDMKDAYKNEEEAVKKRIKGNRTLSFAETLYE